MSEMYVVRYNTDLYEWGKGWLDSKQHDLWHSYLGAYALEEHHPFNVMVPKDSFSAHQLYSIYSMVYLHPMNGLVRLHDEREVDAFKEFMEVLVNHCMGKVTFAVQKVEFELRI